jgi:hypothetical protein
MNGTEQSLADRCRSVGEVVCHLGGFVRRQLNKKLEEPISDTDWQQHGRVAVFLAFLNLDGNPDRPDGFDWYAKSFVAKALSILQQITIGSESDVYDRIVRCRQRRSARNVDELRWDCWASASLDDIAGHRAVEDFSLDLMAPTSLEQMYEFERAAARPQVDDALVQELTKNLKPQEAVWLIRRYRDGVPTAILAEELCRKNVKYQTPDGQVRAIRCIDVAVHRARAKARKFLNSRWQQLAAEVS